MLIRLVCFICFSLFNTYLSANDFIISVLSTEEKVGQLLMIHFSGDSVNEDLKKLLKETHAGGIIYYSWCNPLSNPSVLKKLSQELNTLSENEPPFIPLMIAIDQEGGLVSRLQPPFSLFPGNAALGYIQNPELTEKSAYAMGIEMQAAGIQLNFAPVLDINPDQVPGVMGIRSFGSNPLTVSQLALFACKGFHRAGICTTVKHFPGHGTVKTDSHEFLPIQRKNLDELRSSDFIPFRMLSGDTDAMMTAHMMVPELDPDHCVTFSNKILNTILRDEFNFDGVLISDSLIMQGIYSGEISIEEVALKAFLAGHDILLLGGKQLLFTQQGFELSFSDIKNIHSYLVSAVKKGIISEERLNASIRRILALKAKIKQFSLSLKKDSELTLPCPCHQMLAQEIAEKALEIVSSGLPFSPLNLNDSSLLILAPRYLEPHLDTASIKTLIPHSHLMFIEEETLTANFYTELESHLERADLCLFIAFNAWRSANQLSIWNQLKDRKVPLACIVTGVPEDSDFFKDARMLIRTRSPNPYSLKKAIELLFPSLAQSQEILD